MKKFCLSLAAFVVVFAFASSASAVPQEVIDKYVQEKSTPAPTLPNSWAQGGPYSLEALRGKVIFLVYYEEGCPSCRKRWPARAAAAKKYDGKPIVFIAVNSGNAPERVLAYMRSVRCDWPTIADTDRSFEQASGVGTISLRNIEQTRIISPEGKLVAINKVTWDDGTVLDLSTPDKAAEYFLKHASFRIDPEAVPARYKQAWDAFEFGRPADAVKRLRLLAPKSDADTAFYEKINALLAEDAASRIAKAEAAAEAGEKWKAYQLYDGIRSDFAGHPQGDAARDAWRELAADPQVKNEKAAATMLARIRVLAANRHPAKQAQAKQAAALLIKKYPDTEAAQAARAFQ